MKKTQKQLEILPDEIKAEFESFETINPANNRYIAKPRFLAYPENYLIGWNWVVEYTSNDGRKWFVRKYSPCRGFYDVIYCLLTK